MAKAKTRNELNLMQMIATIEEIDARRVAYTLIEAGLEASIQITYSVRVPKHQERDAHIAIFQALEKKSAA